MNAQLSRVEIRDERDVVLARQRALAVAARLGFEAQDQARVAAAVSEVARNAVQYAGGGLVEFGLGGDLAPALEVRVVDRGPGLAEPPAERQVPPGRRSGPVPGLDGARRMMDALRIDSEPGVGTTVTMTKALPRRAAPLVPPEVARIVEELVRLAPPSPIEELLRQNRDLLRAFDDLRAREQELAQVNRELEDTNRGVLALYVELDERADSLRRASELKTRFLSNVSHELRTPLTSVLSLSRLLLDRADGELSVEQERQVTFILRAAHDLTGMVNDLLDLARIEAGRDEVRVGEVDLGDLFGALRAMLRPLMPPGSPVELVLEDPSTLPTLHSDEGKLSTILRNLLSNALKFTERGEVRARAAPGPGDSVIFTVSDTGVGIHPGDLDLIFEEFGQVDGPLQRKVKGSGLGLPLTRKLALLLGGRVEVRSEPGAGSTFTVTLPMHHRGEALDPALPPDLVAEAEEDPTDA